MWMGDGETRQPTLDMLLFTVLLGSTIAWRPFRDERGLFLKHTVFTVFTITTEG